MSFCWFTSFIGYPNFFKESGNAHDLGRAFITLAEAALNGKSYSTSKTLFPNLDHAQVETKKAAFQEFGLMYVIPRSDVICLTPMGREIYELAIDPKKIISNMRKIQLLSCHALGRYQFDNPLQILRAQSSDVLPYLASYYLLMKLDGLITVSELKGAVFGMQSMNELRAIENQIRDQRKSGSMFMPLKCLPSNKKTSENLKIYFISHLSLDGQILETTVANYYGKEEQAFEITQVGKEILESLLNEEWPNWRTPTSIVPSSKKYSNIKDYFENGIGRISTNKAIKWYKKKVQKNNAKISKGILEPDDIDELKKLPLRKFEEGNKRLISHVSIEKTRNASLIKSAKKYFKAKYGKLFCELCSFDFEAAYGKRGKDYIEAHHKIPISELETNVILDINDLYMVCANCHRMLHRPAWITAEDLIEIIKNQKGSKS